ncbi:DnaJ domain [Macleaya cordata]|uniref:DnaJ domain n=1 Tax=Macleaya cordata TaxID=56857 RepID=A0A200PY78_MACCD|nr:DnaJ domain [Macleaya cordata]
MSTCVDMGHGTGWEESAQPILVPLNVNLGLETVVQLGGGASTNSSKRSNNYSRRFRKMHAKETLLRNVSAYAECLFQSWQGDDDYSEPSSSKGSSWFKRQYWSKGPKRNSSGSQGPQWETYRGRRGVFHFCNDNDEEVETIFRSAFGGERFTYWSFINDDYSQRRNSSGYSNNHRSSWNWRYRCEDEYDTYEQYNDSSDSSESDLASYRLALGLSASGPLKLEDVKSAYRACALKWHPDRHQGSSKVVAEEKFKLCSAAYQSLCGKLD